MRVRWLAMAMAIAFSCLLGTRWTLAAEWDPGLFKEAETLELRTVGPEEGEHWSPVWVVVVDGQVFVRLGSRAAERMRANQTGPEVGVRVNGLQFDAVQTLDAPEYAARVNAAMAEKYWSDIFVRYFSHPMTLRLMVVPAAAGGGPLGEGDALARRPNRKVRAIDRLQFGISTFDAGWSMLH